MEFSLERFESYAYGQDLEMAMRELINLLTHLDAHYGGVGQQFRAQSLVSVAQEDVHSHIWTRAAAAAGCLLGNKGLFVNPEWRVKVLTLHRWLGALFSATPIQNTDHIIRSLNRNVDKENRDQVLVAQEDMLKFCFMYSSESEVPLNLDAIWEHDPALATSLAMLLLSPRFLGTPSGHSKREILLPWLTERLPRIADVDLLPTGVLHDVYMHCSYADRADKHDIKRSINVLIRRKLSEQGLLDSVFEEKRSKKRAAGKPVLLVILEWFSKAHSIYRTHSKTIEEARQHFHVVGMAYEGCVDDVTKQVFDEFIAIDQTQSMIEQLRLIQQESSTRNAQIMYMPSVGMFPLTMWLSNLRVAPIQAMALGHPATTHAHAVDYVVVEEDYVGDESCFSEKLLKLPSDGMPYRASGALPEELKVSEPRLNPEVVQIALCATTMKLNPGFLETCARIVQQSSVPVHFHMLIGQAQGLIYPAVKRLVARFLGSSATVYPHQNYDDYMRIIAGCDLFINPFPFGNTNGIIDTVTAGLVGICKTGREVHEHIDEGIFNRLGFPDWMTTHTNKEYIQAVVRLANEHELRAELCKTLAGPERIQKMFEGRAHILGEKFLALVQAQVVKKEDAARLETA